MAVTVVIFGIICVCINVCILCPLILYYMVKLYKMKSINLVIFKRRPNMIILSGIIVIIYLCVIKSVAVLVRIELIDMNKHGYIKYI